MCGNPRRYFRDLTRQELLADAPAEPDESEVNAAE
jgi:hypothetical protein